MEPFKNLLNNLDTIKNKGILYTTFINISEITKGGFGTVYQATHILDSKKYAIKKIPLLVKNNKTICKNIYNNLTEVRCLSDLYHPNIIRYNTSWMEKQDAIDDIDYVLDLNYDNLSDYNQLNIFIQMELMDINLKQYLLNYDPSKDNKNQIIKSIIAGVKYLHSKNIIHCDLKPDNILLNLNNQESIYNIKIGDFGLVIQKNRTIYIDNNYGTAIYMPPELEYSFKYDIYSLGIIFFEIIKCFPTLMEKYAELTKFKNGQYFKQLPNITQMININPDIRPNINQLNIIIN